MKVMDFNQLSQIMSKIIISGRYKEMSKTKSKDDLIFLRQSNHCDFLLLGIPLTLIKMVGKIQRKTCLSPDFHKKTSPIRKTGSYFHLSYFVFHWG